MITVFEDKEPVKIPKQNRFTKFIEKFFSIIDKIFSLPLLPLKIISVCIISLMYSKDKMKILQLIYNFSNHKITVSVYSIIRTLFFILISFYYGTSQNK